MYRHCFAPWLWRRAAQAAWVVWVAVLALAAAALAPGAAEAASTAAASWHGRAIKAPHQSAVPADADRWPAGWSAGRVRLGSGYTRPDGSARVRATQRMLRRLGYRPGPVDGRFGPRTAAAVAWFQHKHGLPRTRTVGKDTLALLRARAAGEPDVRLTDAEPPVDERSRPAVEPVAERPTGTGGGFGLAPLLLGLALLVVLLATVVPLRRSRTRAGAAAVEAPGPERPRAIDVLGYVALPRDAAPDGVPREVLGELEALCVDRGWSLAKVIHDVEPESGRMSDRSGLFYALELLGSDEAAALVVLRLSDLTTDAHDLGMLMRSIEQANASLVALDVGLDTTTPEGERTARTLIEIGAWSETDAGSDSAPPPGRPPFRPPATNATTRDDPELVAWIERLRGEGMSLEAIADTLNQHGVPTRRGGSRWRPSSVQAALGYKRPASRQGAGKAPRFKRTEG